MHSKVQKSKARYFLKVCTAVPLSILHYLRATISHVIIEQRFCGDDVFMLLFVLLRMFRADHASEKNDGKPCPTFVLQQQN